MSDYFGIIAESNFTINEGEICKLCNLSLLQYSHLDEPQLEYGFHNDRNMREKGLLISINSSSDEYFSKLKNANNKIISDTARRNRKIQRDLGPIKFCFNVKPKEERCTVLRTLINKKRGQYQRTGVADSLRESWKQDLLHALLHNQNNHCHGILSTMYAGNTWVASHFGLQCLNRLHYWFPVYNPKLVKYSPGRLLMYSVISESPNCKTPISIIDRGAGVSKAKEDFANNEHYFLRGELFNPKLSSISFKIFQSIRWKLIPQLRS
jgi:hypothetical protein